MKLFVGLGNPGAKYAGNRHNIGVMALDRIASDHGFAPWRSKFQGEVCEGTLSSEKSNPAQTSDIHEPLWPIRGRGNALLQTHTRGRGGVSRRAGSGTPAKSASKPVVAMRVTTVCGPSINILARIITV